MKALEDFKTSLEDKVNSIPSDKLCAPPLAVVGPALEASKYYFEESKIREMFASIISASMDSRKVSHVHPAFPIIVQQMSRLDAKNLERLHSSDDMLPICEYQVRCPDDDLGDLDLNKALLFAAKMRVIRTNILLENIEDGNLDERAASITSLVRLGLIDLDYERSIIGFDYQVFERIPEYLELLEECSSTELPYVQRGCIGLTPLGKDLCAICFSDNSP